MTLVDLELILHAWFTGARLMALHLLWIILVFSFIYQPKILLKYLRVWALFISFFCILDMETKYMVLQILKMHGYIMDQGQVTHILNGGTLIRYFSTFSDAANYACHAAASAVAFFIFGITSKIKIEKIFFLLIASLCYLGYVSIWNTNSYFLYGSRIHCFSFLSKSFKIAIPCCNYFCIFHGNSYFHKYWKWQSTNSKNEICI